MYQKKRKTKFSDRLKLTNENIPDIPPARANGKSRVVNDTTVAGLYLNVSGYGSKVTKTWRVRHRQNGATSSFKLGRYPDLLVAEAREKALAFQKAPQTFLNPTEIVLPTEKPHKTFREVAEVFLAEHVQQKKLKSQDEITRVLQKYVYPHWEHRPFREIKKFDVAELLRAIQRDVSARATRGNSSKPYTGARQADIVLAAIRKMTIWYAANPLDERDNDYVSPVVRGMNKDDNAPRKRILSREEIRVIWNASKSKELGVYGAMIRMLLLTAQRREKISTMRYADVVNGVWKMPIAKQEKGHIGQVKLPETALEIIKARKQKPKNPYVFPGRGSGPFNSWSDGKETLDALVRKELPDIERWTVHDLRRTARTLMSEAKVDVNVAERTMGHKIGGVRGTYDWYAYEPEKSAALESLSTLITEILAETRVRRRGIRPVTGAPMVH